MEAGPPAETAEGEVPAATGGTDESSATVAVAAGPPAEGGASGPDGEVLAAAGGTDESSAAGGDIRTVAERVLYLQLKRTLASPSLAVRQVSLCSCPAPSLGMRFNVVAVKRTSPQFGLPLL